VLNLLTAPRAARTVRGLLGTVADAVRSVIFPAALVQEQEPTAAPDPADVYAPEEMPETGVIEAAAAEYERAAEQARRADPGKRAARKVLDRLPAGLYGAWIVERVASSRQTADLDAIREIFKANGLGPVPMKPCAPSLKVRRAETVPSADTTEALAVAA
jgi:hypothetical protein